ncbi:acyl carrier protein [Candidatus Puniceispirillum sp.]|nr:acyl carrier protein [Alphaproteobacteria bacterium]MDC1293840.1 acyl carrier protein [Candidatus Puniceispirillum sp.]
MLDEIEVKITEIFSRVVDVPLDSVSITMTPSDVENWDSMRHIMLLLAVESDFELKFSDVEMVSIGTLAELIDLVKSKSV